MGELLATMLATLKGSSPEAYVLVQIDGEAGSNQYLWTHAKHGALSFPAGSQMYEGRILSAGKISQVAPGLEGSVKAPTVTLVVDDTDLVVSKAIFDINQRRAVRVYITTIRDDGAIESFQVFAGIVDSVAQQSGGEYQIKCRYDDDWLKQKLPFNTFRGGDHSNMDAKEEGLAVPIVAGISSGPAFFEGDYPCYFIDTTLRRFAVCGHRLQINLGGAPGAFTTVFVSNKDNDWTTMATVDRPYGEAIIGGQTYGYFDLVAGGPVGWVGAFPGADIEVRARLDAGMHNKGAIWEGLGGALATVEGETWDRVLKYLAWRNWRQGLYTSVGTTPPVGSISGAFAAPFSGGNTCAGWLGGQSKETAYQFLRNFCQCHSFSPYFAWGGNLSAFWWDYLGQTPYPTATIDWDAPGVKNMMLEHSYEQDVAHILANCQQRVGRDGSREWKIVQRISDSSSPSSVERKYDIKWIPGLPTSTQANHMVRQKMSQIINRHRKRMPDLKCTLPLWYLDYTLGQDFGVAWDRGPNMDGTVGWSKDNNWSRWMYRLTQMHINLDTLEIDARLEDSQSAQTTLWATYHSLLGTTPGEEAGVCEVQVGNEGTRVATNPASTVWVDDPSSGTCHLLGATDLPLDAASETMYDDAIEAQGGLMVQRAQTGLIPGSFFDAASLGTWIKFGAPLPSFVRNTDARFYSQDVALDGYAVLTSTVATSGIYYATGAITPTYLAVAITYRYISGVPIKWVLWRTGGSGYWNDTTKVWQIPYVENPLSSSPVGMIKRFRSNGITTSGASLPYYLYLTHSAAGSVALYEMQLMSGVPWAGSRIKGTATRAAQTLTYPAENSSGHHIWPDAGSLEVDFVPQWNSGDMAVGDAHYILDLRYGANDQWSLYQVEGGGNVSRWRFVVKAGGVTSTVTLNKEASRGRAYKIKVLWAGSNAELGLADHTYQLSVEGGGSKTTSAVVVGAATPAYLAAQYLFVGSTRLGTLQCDGWIRNLRIKPYVEAV